MKVHPTTTPYQSTSQPKNTLGFKFVAVGDLEIKEPEYIVEDLFETETMGLIFGDPGCGKSFLAVDIALSVATGTAFHGRAVRKGPVFFIAGEGHNGLARRFHAWAHDRGVPLLDVPLFKSERAAQFLDADSAKSVTNAVANLAAQHGLPALIIVDTLARNFGAGDENNTKDMSEFVVAIDALKARFLGCSVLIVHHSGHAEKQRARGSMALKGALDSEYRVEKDGVELTLRNTKMKDADKPDDLFFRFHQVNLNDTAKSAVLVAMDAPKRQAKLTPMQKLAQTTYKTASVCFGIWEDGAFRGVHIDNWRDEFYAKHTGDNTETKKKAFQRVRKDMTEHDMMNVQDDVYFIHDPAIQTEIMLRRDIAGQKDIYPAAEAENSGTNGTTP